MMHAPRVPRAWFDWLTLPRSSAIIAVVVGGFGYCAWSSYRHGGMDAMGGVVTWGVLVAFVLAAPLIAFVAGYFGWVEERTWAPWQGIYHAFDDAQIRVAEARDTLWFSSADVHAALGLVPRTAMLKSLRVSEYRRDDALGDVLSNAGLGALFGRSTDRQTLRLLAWADRDVRKPWRNRRDGVEVACTTRRTDVSTVPSVTLPAATAPSPPATAIRSRSRPIDR